MTDSDQIILQNRIEQIEEALKRSSRMRYADRLMLESQRDILVFLSDDHRKTKMMYAWFRPMAYMVLIVVSAVLTMAATGKITVTLMP